MSEPKENRMCVECGSRSVSAATIAHSAEVRHDGKLHSVKVEKLPVRRCEHCGEVYFTLESDEAITAALRAKLSLLSPEQIATNRKALGMTQAQLAEAIGAAQESLSRWENGHVIQSRGTDRLLRAYFHLPELRSFMEALRSSPALGSKARVQSKNWRSRSA